MEAGEKGEEGAEPAGNEEPEPLFPVKNQLAAEGCEGKPCELRRKGQGLIGFRNTEQVK